MKQLGVFGKGYGKIGNSVWSIQKGEQVVRPYNSEVTNPNTVAQVDQRTRFKLASQLAAAMSSVIVIPGKGLTTPRNFFVKKNMPYIYAGDAQATAILEQFQLTSGSRSLPDVTATRSEENGDMRLIISLLEPASIDIERVVYTIFVVCDDGSLSLAFTDIMYDAGKDRDFLINTANIQGKLLIYAYGMKDNSIKATSKFDKYRVDDGETLARLFAQRKLKVTEYSFTETKGIIMPRSVDETHSPGSNEVYIDLIIIGQGVVEKIRPQNYAFLNGRMIVPRGETIELEAGAPPEWAFDGWFFAGENIPFEATEHLLKIANQNMSLVAQFHMQSME